VCKVVAALAHAGKQTFAAILQRGRFKILEASPNWRSLA